MRQKIAVLLALCVLAAGCTGKASGAKPSGTTGATTTTSTSMSAASPKPTVTPAAAALPTTPPAPGASAAPPSAAASSPQVDPTLLASAGIATVADESSTVPLAAVNGSTVLTLTSWQVDNLSREAAQHGGLSAGDLDTMLPLPTDSPPMADLVGGWLITKADPDATTAASLMGGQSWGEPERVLFPTAVLMMFIADLLQHVATAPAAASSTSTSGFRHAGQVMTIRNASLVTAPCSAVSGFVDSVLGQIFGALKLSVDEVSDYLQGKLGDGVIGQALGGVVSFFAGIIKAAISLAEQAARTFLKALSQPVLNVLAIAIGGLAVFTSLRSYLKVWKLDVTPEPTANLFAVDPKPGLPGSFTVIVNPNDEISDWPTQFVDCAKAVGVALPTLASAGAPVTWTLTGQPDIVAAPTLTGTLSDKLMHSLTYATGHEDRKTAAGTAVTSPVTAGVSVRRTEIDQLRALVIGYLTGKVPDVVAPVVNPILAGFVEDATTFLDTLTAVTGSATIGVVHHLMKPTPTPPPPASCAGTGTGTGTGTTVPAGHFAGPISAQLQLVLHVQSQLSADGNGVQTLGGTVDVTSDGRTVHGTMKASGRGKATIGIPGGVHFSQASIGDMVGTISGPASAPIAAGTLTGSTEDGPTSSSFRAGLHLTSTSCTAISGDLVAMFQEIERPVAAYLTITGTGVWTAPRH